MIFARVQSIYDLIGKVNAGTEPLVSRTCTAALNIPIRLLLSYLPRLQLRQVAVILLNNKCDCRPLKLCHLMVTFVTGRFFTARFLLVRLKSNFKSTVHENKSLTNAEKLYYLLGKLSDKAQSAFSGICPDGNNYKIIFDSLVSKYENKRLLASTYLNQMFDHKQFNVASIDNFGSFSDNFVSAANASKNLKIDNLSDFILFHIAIKKNDSETARLFEMSSKDKIPSFDSLVKFIKEQSCILMNTSTLHGSSSRFNLTSKAFDTISHKILLKKLSEAGITGKAHDILKSYFQNRSQIPRAVASTVINKPAKCMCDNFIHEHLYKCPAFSNLSPSDRFKSVKQLDACINCLSSKHKANVSQSKSRCKVCQNKHHSLLHFNNRNTHSSNTQVPSGLSAVARTVPGSTSASSAPPSQRVMITDKSASAQRSFSHASPPPVPLSQSYAQAPDSMRDDVTRAVYHSAPQCNASIAASVDNANCLNAFKQQCTTNTTVLLSTAAVIIRDAIDNSEHLVRCLLDSGSQINFITSECCKRLGLTYFFSDTPSVKGIGGTEKPVKGSVHFQFASRFNSNVLYNVNSLVVDEINDNLPTAPVDISALSYLQGLPLADESFGTPGRIDVLIGASLFPHLLLPRVVSSNSSAPPAVQTVLGYVIMGTVPALPTRRNKASLACCSYLSQPPDADTLETALKKFWQVDEAPSASTSIHRPQSAIRTQVDTLWRAYRRVYFGKLARYCEETLFFLEKKLESRPELHTAYNDVIREYVDKDYLSPAPLASSEVSRPDYVIPHHAVVRLDKTTTRLRSVLDASSKTSSDISLNDILHSGPNLQGDLFTILLNFRLFAMALSADCRQMFLQIGVRESDRRFQRIFYRFSMNDPLVLYRFNRVCFGLKSSPYHALRTIQQLIEDDGHTFPLASAVASDCLYMDDIVFSELLEPRAVQVAHELIQLFRGGQFDLVKWTSHSQAQLEFDKSVEQKVLDLRWCKSSDCFEFLISAPPDTCTILTAVARLWDIMGFVAPVLFAKLLIKELWLLKLDWDDEPPRHIKNIWHSFRAALPLLNNFKMPRHLGLFENCILRLIGFSDASERAYGAVVYAHITRNDEDIVQLVCAKSKVSPVKPLTIARLELCGAELLSKLLRRVYDTYDPRYKVTSIHAFTDSKVTLCWINSSPHRWQTFVANRIVRIVDNVPAERFYHVAGTENPADCLSRGLTPDKFIEHPLWLHGPAWAKRDPSEWPINKITDLGSDSIPEEKVHAHPVPCLNSDSLLLALAERTSSWTKLLRVIVFVYRFMKKLPRRNSNVTASDLEFAENILLCHVQKKYFFKDFANLKDNKCCSPALIKLKPFLDNDLIRCGGRLSYSAETYNTKHPVVLPRRDRIVELLIDYYHKKYLHAGPELTLSLLRHKYWILSARRIIRYRIHKCNACHRYKPRPQSLPIMSDLPNFRVTAAIKAFSHTGCDYAGPIQYVPIRARGAKSRKGYLCVFTCMTTRAIHIELATDLATVSFIAALKRFLSRRGPVQCLYSDNATNFRGANSYLRSLYDFLDKEYRPRFEEELAEHRIKFLHIPSASSHFGGCWESMIKTVKTHLYYAIGQQLLSYEELVTILTQIECLLNSRPLTALSSDPSEPTALTPSHFLHTLPLHSLPAAEIGSSTAENLLDRHSLMDK
ncbi:hypothetical protein ABMA27_010456 [Loxostege sticticalis]|uniref:Integrase catalytic domain-containing protein n=1 Tax=Loxostege sticticalis TaxID=481309 RepID=A0ABR3H5S1_LOXSC